MVIADIISGVIVLEKPLSFDNIISTQTFRLMDISQLSNIEIAVVAQKQSRTGELVVSELGNLENLIRRRIIINTADYT